jgi:hypothetical protein
LIPNFLDEYSDGIRPRLTVACSTATLRWSGLGEILLQPCHPAERAGAGEAAFLFGYCNGYHQYFPTIEAVAEGGYGADATVLAGGSRSGRKIDEYRLDLDLSDAGKDKVILGLRAMAR